MNPNTFRMTITMNTGTTTMVRTLSYRVSLPYLPLLVSSFSYSLKPHTFATNRQTSQHPSGSRRYPVKQSSQSYNPYLVTPVTSSHGSVKSLSAPKPRDTMMLPAPMIAATARVPFLRPNLHFSSKVRIEISKKVNSEEMTANASARKKQMPMSRPPGSLLKISVITKNTRPGPFWTSTPAANADGMITNPARTAAPVSQMDTKIASDLKLLLFGILAPRVVKIPQPMPTENSTCGLRKDRKRESAKIREQVIFQAVHSAVGNC